MKAEIRPVHTKEEAADVLRVGRRSFHPLLGMLITRVKWGFGAWDGDTCLGGIILKERGQFGIVEFIFIAAEGRGLGLGKRLTERAFEAFDERGLKYAVASVRDDNTASWNLFAGRGFRTYSSLRCIREFGFRSWFALSLATSHLFAFGFDLWIGRVDQALNRDEASALTQGDTVPGSSIGTFVLHYLLHMVAVASVALFQSADGAVAWALAIGAILTIRLIFSYLATLPFFRPGRIRMARGGHLVEIVVNALGSFFFYPAYWHPRKARWREPDYRTGLGVSALAGSLSVVALVVASSLLLRAGSLESGLAATTAGVVVGLGKPIIVIDLQPIFEAWAGPRIRRWNLWVYLVAAAAGVATVVLA